jgi:hypothetical protein
MESVKTVSEMVSDEQLVEDAYNRIKGDLALLQPEDLVQVNLDIPSAVTTVLGVLPEVRALRDRMAKELPTFDLASTSWKTTPSPSASRRRAT